jgi:tRNA 2-selenouridine synthase
MAVQKIKVDEFIALANKYPVLDVRSLGEYNHAHIPGAHSFPLFSDDERKVVGTAYKQQGRGGAVKIGLDYFGVKMRSMVEEAERIANSKTVLVHCWRGGMRSAGVAWLLDLYGFKVITLTGGYKAFRNWVLQQFDKNYSLKLIGGYTGSGKTALLKLLGNKGATILDLEAIAGHKGSAFGGLDGITQPTQEMFENILALELEKKAGDENGIWLEDESQRVGLVNIPKAFWDNMRRSPMYFLDIPFEERLNNIVAEYGGYDKEKLIDAVKRIQKRLGGLDTKMAINYLQEDNVKEAFRVLLRYYDKYYIKAMNNREDTVRLVHKIPCPSVHAGENIEKLSIQKLAL